ncbi:MAG: DUF2071 domain-containing protein [Bacteroidetes bacterium]|nr:DUF2071 domain-containing protein [Bacteroidota bacterium]
MSVFLTAKWNNLINITYAVDPEILLPHLPKGLNLDIIDGKAFVSFVAFEFNDVCVKGFRIPFHRSFPEINLRFYVNKNGKRGVVFIKEFVPKYFVARIANTIYNEPYSSIKMKNTVENSNNEIRVKHSFCLQEEWFDISVTAENKSIIPPFESMEHFFKEHDIGFGKSKKNRTIEYLVEHPVWEVYPNPKVESNVCFEKIYGKKWAFLDSQKPFNVLLAKGSEVKVFDKK